MAAALRRRTSARLKAPSSNQQLPHLSHPLAMPLQAELSWLIRAVNPEQPLSEEALALIAGEVFQAYPAHIKEQGLTLEGLQQLYADGCADPERDFQLLMQHGSQPAAQAEPATNKRQRLDSSSAAGLASVARLQKPGLVPGDIFADLASPVDAAGSPLGAGSGEDTIKASQGASPAGPLWPAWEQTQPGTPSTGGADAFDFLSTPRENFYGAPAGLAPIATVQQWPFAAGGRSQPVTPAADIFDGLLTPASAEGTAAGGFQYAVQGDGMGAAGMVAGQAAASPAWPSMGSAPNTGGRIPDVFDSVQTPVHGELSAAVSTSRRRLHRKVPPVDTRQWLLVQGMPTFLRGERPLLQLRRRWL